MKKNDFVKNELIKHELISVIVPVYNVSCYIDRCLDSITQQTYKNLEILLINDGSTDDSALKCLEWQKRDSRIVFISKKNEHVGPTRNLGITMSHGNILAFVDPDDYIDIHFIKKMYHNLIISKADFTCCDFYSFQDDDPKKKTLHREKFSGIKYFAKDIETISISCQLWNKMYHKRLFLENDLWMSERIGQDVEISFKLMANARSVSFVNEPLYNYQLYRDGAATTGINQLYDMIEVRKNIADYYIKRNLFEKYYRPLKISTVYSLNGKLQKAQKLLETSEYQDFQKNCFSFLNKYYPDWIEEKHFIVWGSYNLRQVLYLSGYGSAANIKRYMYSSIISAMSDKPYHSKNDLPLQNEFQKRMIEQDFYRDFYFSDKQSEDYIIIDFLEERFDILAYEDIFVTAGIQELKSDLYIPHSPPTKKAYH